LHAKIDGSNAPPTAGGNINLFSGHFDLKWFAR
jgi:hypothetical protein